MFSGEFCEIFKNTLFTEHLFTTASEYREDLQKKYVQRIKESFWCLYCELGTDFRLCSGVSIIDFEQVHTGLEIH